MALNQLEQSQVKGLKEFIDERTEWQKPADWIDIRSGALPNSVYFLVGHSADYTQYPTFSVFATVSNGGTYDVYVDGLKQATTANNVGTVLNWQTLALTSGYDTTYPSALRTHIVRITPTLSTNTFSGIRLNQTPESSELVHGLLWVHFTTANAIIMGNAFGSAYKAITPILEAATGNIMPYKAATNAFRYSNVKHIDTIDASSAIGIESAFFHATNLQSVTIDGNNNSIKTYVAFSGCTSLKKVVFKNIQLITNNSTFQDCTALKEVSGLQLDCSADNNISPFRACSSFNTSTVLDFSGGVNCARGIINQTPGIKAITVSPEAPFNSTTSPQINVSYTGLDRAALINLFKSMPTVSASQVCNIVGTTGAADLTVDDLAVAVNKGWTIMR